MRRKRSTRPHRQVLTALRRGESRHAGTSTRLTFTGTFEQLPTFTGPVSFATGRLDGYHHDHRVLSVDFDAHQVTDFGYHGHSLTTTRHLNNWWWGLDTLHFEGTPLLDAWPFLWTVTRRRRHRDGGEIHPLETARQRLRWARATTAPWIIQREGTPWLDARRFDLAAADASWCAVEAALMGPRWRWLTGAWRNGQWVTFPIDDDAAARYNRWCRRQGCPT